MKFFLSIIILTLFITLEGWCQTTLCGYVKTKKAQPVAGANIYLKNTFEGISSDSLGFFSFQTNLKGEQKLRASFLGYKNFEQQVVLCNDTLKFSIILLEDETNLDEIVITAGTFEAGDEKKSATLGTLDLATNSQGFGDIYMAISALPGTSNSDDEGGLLVRGGEQYETKTFIDGLLVESPYTAKMPSVPVRGKFSPMLFRGTVFSTGGYSAEYGQALSSALILNSIALPKNDETNIALYSSAANFTKIKKWDKTSLSSITQYVNTRPYYKIANSNIKWHKAPENFSETLVFRQKVNQDGMLKAMGFFNSENNSLYYPNMNSGKDDLIGMQNRNYFFLASYKDQIGRSILQSGISFNRDIINMKINEDDVNDRNQSAQFKLTVSDSPSEKITLNYGADTYYKKFERFYLPGNNQVDSKWEFVAINTSAFAESDLRVTNNVALRIGGRFEYLGLSQKAYFEPRLSAAYQTSMASQVSLAYGKFIQLPEDNSLLYANKLLPEKASHFILNYQILKESRTFRVEVYYKDYSNLVKYDSLYATNPSAYSNAGSGYARGVDVFFRDRKTIKNGDFWLAYSFIDSQRDYRDFFFRHTPAYISTHNLSLQYKHYFDRIDAYLTTNYNFASGRPYIDPNFGNKIFYSKDYHNLSVGFYHFTTLFGKFTMLHAQVSNILGFNHVFGYRFAGSPDLEGSYKTYPIVSPNKRMIIFGIYLSLQNRTEF
jgi:hypothetical protein